MHNCSLISRTKCVSPKRQHAAHVSIDSRRGQHFQLQVTGNVAWANDKVPLMQQNCVDEVLNRNYTEVDELNDTAAVINETRRIIEVELSPVLCRPFDCNGNGRCVNGTCICNLGMYGTFMPLNTITYANV